MLFATICFVTLFLNCNAGKRNVLVEYAIKTVDQLERLQKESINHYNHLVDAPRLGKNYALLQQKDVAKFEAEYFGTMRSGVETKHHDYERYVKDERINCRSIRVSRSVNAYELEKCHPLEEIEDHLHQLAKTYKENCELKSIGLSYENRTMWMLKVSQKSSYPKKAVWIDATTHAREWQTTATSVYVLTELLKNIKSKKNKKLNKMMEFADWYFVPVVNPDGYKYSWDSDRYQRKNREPNSCDKKPENLFPGHGIGTDLNRNYPYAWGKAEFGQQTGFWKYSSPDPCDDTYHGPSPASAPETRNLMKTILELKSSLGAVISVHSASDYWFFPYSNCSEANSYKCYTSDHKDMQNLGDKIVAAILETNGNVYKVGTSSELLYGMSGAAIDWVKSVGIKYSFLPELKNAGKGIYLFDPALIIPTGQDMISAFYEVALQLHKETLMAMVEIV